MALTVLIIPLVGFLSQVFMVLAPRGLKENYSYKLVLKYKVFLKNIHQPEIGTCFYMYTDDT